MPCTTRIPLPRTAATSLSAVMLAVSTAACGGQPANSATAPALSGEAVERLSSQYQNYRVVRLAEGLEHPWALAFLPDGSLLVSERPGRLQHIDGDGKREIGGLPDDIQAAGQGGLLDVVLHPEYADNGWIYLTYSKGDSEATATTLIRARLDGERLTDVEQLFTQDRRSSPGRHYGSRLAFMPDGTLLMSIGDRGVEPPRSQDNADHAGTLLRLNDDGSVPDDNPFVGDDDVRPEIYSYGHRNIQGLIVHPETGAIWATEHGPRGGDELNLVEAGVNYGWPVVSLGRDYGNEGPYTTDAFGAAVRQHDDMVDPQVEWTPKLAPSGLAVLHDGAFEAWEGNLLAGGLRSRQIRRLVLEDGAVVHEEELVRDVIGRIRDVRQGPDGLIYIVTDESDGGVYRLEPT